MIRRIILLYKPNGGNELSALYVVVFSVAYYYYYQ